MRNLGIDDIISSVLSSFEHEDALYCKPISIADWYDHWDFDEYDANIYNHGLHQYPARFVPQLARKLLRTFANKDSVVLDIFSGSGTTLLECKYLGIKTAIGIELNPFANFMASIKLSSLEVSIAKKVFESVRSLFFDKVYPFTTMNFKNIDFWYSSDIINGLSKLFSAIVSIQDKCARDFLLLAFCDVFRKASYVNAGGFKMCRAKSKINTPFLPNVWQEFEKVFERNITLLTRNNEVIKNIAAHMTTSWKLIQGDSRIIHNEIPKESIDFILTSPPYGDSRTTVAYGQYSRLPWQWLSHSDDIIKLDNALLGGRRRAHIDVMTLSPTLKRQLVDISNMDDSNRALDVMSFYSDLYEALKSATYYLKPNCYFIIVTGNRTVKKNISSH